MVLASQLNSWVVYITFTKTLSTMFIVKPSTKVWVIAMLLMPKKVEGVAQGMVLFDSSKFDCKTCILAKQVNVRNVSQTFEPPVLLY